MPSRRHRVGSPGAPPRVTSKGRRLTDRPGLPSVSTRRSTRNRRPRARSRQARDAAPQHADLATLVCPVGERALAREASHARNEGVDSGAGAPLIVDTRSPRPGTKTPDPTPTMRLIAHEATGVAVAQAADPYRRTGHHGTPRRVAGNRIPMRRRERTQAVDIACRGGSRHPERRRRGPSPHRFRGPAGTGRPVEST